MSNPQMTCFQPVRPFNGFESIYQGRPGNTPIAFPGTLDPMAGRSKYASNLLTGIPVPLGARLCAQIPMVVDLYTCEPIYTYQFMWRLRNQQQFNEGMLSGKSAPSAGYHLNGEVPGRREFGIDPSTDLYFMPGASDVEIFEQDAPTGDGAALLAVRQQNYLLQMESPWAQPLAPNASPAIWQQGVYQYSSNSNNGGPTFFPLWMDVNGDELLILAYKVNPEVPWDFSEGGADHGFSNTYGTNGSGLPNNPNIGILISTGTMGGG